MAENCGETSYLNTGMMKAKLSPNLISFVTVRRGDWIMKISVYKNSSVLVLGKHFFDNDRVIIRQFVDKDKAADFIEHLAKEDTL